MVFTDQVVDRVVDRKNVLVTIRRQTCLSIHGVDNVTTYYVKEA